MYLKLSIILIFILTKQNFHSQDNCDESIPLCTSTGLLFPASTSSVAPIGPDYGCLGSQPNPAWFFLNILTGGDIEITLNNSANADLDFVVWGPFNSYLDMETSVCNGNSGTPISCSFSVAAVEIVELFNTQQGEFYMLLITNFAGIPTDVTATQTGGLGSTNCLITSCFISNFTANIGSCQPGSLYDLSGTIDFTTNINTDSLLVTIDDGINVYDTVIFPPYISPTNWSISGLPANGNAISITATFASDALCTLNIIGNAPFDCSCTAQIGDFDVFVNGSLSTNYSLCFGDVIEIVSSNGYVAPLEVTGIPGPDYNPGIGFLIYSCPPTIGVVPSNVPPNDNLTNDPCLIGLIGYGDSFIDTNSLGTPNISGTWNDNTIYIVPLTFYDTVNGTYSFINTSLLCYEMGTPFSIQYLPKIDTANAIDNCLENEFSVNISGGLPSIDGSSFTAFNLLPSNASFESNSVSNGGNIIINGLTLGDNLNFEVTDNNGCSISINGGPFTCEIEDENVSLQFYSAFTPNNDNINDTWRIDGLPDGNHSVKIINRWGDLVWHTDAYHSLTNAWNGENSSGEELPEGVYYYIVSINTQEYKGFIELTR